MITLSLKTYKWVYNNSLPCLFCVEINLVKEAKEALKAKKKREKTVVTGDMQPIANSLPTIAPSVEQYIVDSTSHNNSQT